MIQATTELVTWAKSHDLSLLGYRWEAEAAKYMLLMMEFSLTSAFVDEYGKTYINTDATIQDLITFAEQRGLLAVRYELSARPMSPMHLHISFAWNKASRLLKVAAEEALESII